MANSAVNVILACTALACFLFGLPANLLALAYFGRSYSRTLSDKICMVLSATDSVLCALMLHTFILIIIGYDVQTASFTLTCILYSWSWNILSRFSIFTTCVLSVARLLSVQDPFRRIPPRAVWAALSLILAYLVLYESSPDWYDHRTYSTYIGTCDWTVQTRDNDTSRMVPYHFLYSTMYTVPMVTTIASSLAAFCLLKRRPAVEQPTTPGTEREAANRERAAHTVFLMILLYVACNVPHFLTMSNYDIQIIFGVNLYDLPRETMLVILVVGSGYLVALNAAINPWIYFARMKSFRRFLRCKMVASVNMVVTGISRDNL